MGSDEKLQGCIVASQAKAGRSAGQASRPEGADPSGETSRAPRRAGWAKPGRGLDTGNYEPLGAAGSTPGGTRLGSLSEAGNQGGSSGVGR